jgi:exosome complex RNA-binding protein Rrp42 (RNase PH superfamily)
VQAEAQDHDKDLQADAEERVYILAAQTAPLPRLDDRIFGEARELDVIWGVSCLAEGSAQPVFNLP